LEHLTICCRSILCVASNILINDKAKNLRTYLSLTLATANANNRRTIS
jgi:hypothetical protein